MTSCPPVAQIHERMQEVYIYGSNSKKLKTRVEAGHQDS